MTYKATIYFNDGTRLEITELQDEAKGLRKAFEKRSTLTVDFANGGWNLIDFRHVHNVKISPEANR